MEKKKWVEPLTRALSWPSRILWVISAAVVLIMALHVLADVILRSFTHQPLPATLEFTAMWWMPLVIFTGLGAAQLGKEHLRVTLFLDGIRGKTRRAAEFISLAVAMTVIGMATVFAFEGALASTQIGETVLSAIAVPVWPIKWVAAFGLAVFMVQLLVSFIEVAAASSAELERLDEADEIFEQMEEEVSG
ncbi:TRAP transporter small permease [Arthrobacter sp. NPDC089319]|uniref:TRAP transporter small permease subunit n=1 Tax=Arthrobacter sp. NPDC089319 TaxID=3155915 RepID=UPI003429CF07